MSTMKRVKACEGRKVFFPLVVKAAPGRRTFILEGSEVIEVDTAHRFVRRSIKCGDLVVVRNESAQANEPAAPKAKAKRARARSSSGDQ